MALCGTAVKLNYYALCICVTSERIPEEAFRIMEIAPAPVKFQDDDIDAILEFKKSHTWKQLGEMYGISVHAVRKRVMRFQERQKAKGEIA
jgi:hypothetical protein